nr:retrovirus-related Pol polyprotein from transposon TNT 1-94 [Tanacetum cinerariifolium]
VKSNQSVGISHQVSSIRTPQQNRVVKCRNRTLVEAARTMLIFSHAPLFLWAKAIATVCFTQNRSIIHRRFNRTPYELINGKKPDISFLYVFEALCYPKNDHEDIGKLGAKGLDLTYAPSTITTQQPTKGELDLLFEAMYDDYISGQPSAAQRTILAAQAQQVSVFLLNASMAFEQSSSKPELQIMTSGQISSGLDLTYAPSTITTQQPTSKDEAPEVIKTFLKRITILLQSPVIIIRTDNGTKFENQVLKEYFNCVGISHQVSFVRTPQQNGEVERRNRTLVEAARTMLIFSRAPLFLWAEAIATAKPDISFFHVFEALCYPKNNHEDIGKLGAKGLDLTYAPSTITTQQPTEGELNLLFEAMYDDYIGGQPSTAQRTVSAAQVQQVRQTSMISTSIADTAPTPTNSSS